MSVVEAVLERIRGKRIEAVKSLSVQYDELIKRLACGEQVDVDELAIVLDALDKSHSDVKDDVKLVTEREPKKLELARLRQVRDSISALTFARDEAARKLDEAVLKLRPRLDELNDKIRFAEAQVLQIQSLESALLESAKDPTLLERKNTIASLRHPVVTKLRDLEPELQTARSRLSFAESQLSTLLSDRSGMGAGDISGRATVSEKIETAKQAVKNWQRTVDNLAGVCGELRSEVAGYDRELRTIAEQMIAS